MNKPQTIKFDQHPLALRLVPGSMPDDEFEAFCADIGKRGQRAPIIIFEDKILDGWHRYRACTRLGITPKTEVYDGDDPSGLVIALNVLRRKLGATQRALAGARLNIDFSITQDEASKRVGVSKVHINLVVQALNSNNARVIKMLENPELTRAALHEDLVECGIVRMPSTPLVATKTVLSASGAGIGLENLFGNPDLDDDLLGGEEPNGSDSIDLEDVLGAPPSAGGKVISFDRSATTEGGMPVVGSKPGHPERRSKDTPASLLCDRFKGLGEADQISFMQLTWHLQRKLLKAAGLSESADASPSTKAVSVDAQAKPSKATTAQAAKAAQAAQAAIGAAKGKAPAKVA